MYGQRSAFQDIDFLKNSIEKGF